MKHKEKVRCSANWNDDVADSRSANRDFYPTRLASEAPTNGSTQKFRTYGRGFTLLELLTVIGVIALLAALLLPALHATRIAALKAKTRVQFAHWSGALEGFRSEYGYYPALHSSNLVNPPGQNTDASSLHLFHDLLAARRRDSSALPAWEATTNPQFPEAQNKKLITFHAFSDSDFTPDSLLQDAFGNTEIAVLVDRNLDGVINGADYGELLPAVAGLRPSAQDFPISGIHAGAIFYSPAPGATLAAPAFIFSWK